MLAVINTAVTVIAASYACNPCGNTGNQRCRSRCKSQQDGDVAFTLKNILRDNGLDRCFNGQMRKGGGHCD